ncbi:MAG: hypothetical protein IKG93_10065 [Clostridiales bacterium]|nr:hypothetical protein [Clostridiales bacterium]
MNENTISAMHNAFETACVDYRVDSDLALRPRFLTNNHLHGEKVLSAQETELLDCDEFQFCDERTDNTEDRLNRPGSGYTRVVTAGDGDILTEDTMYDMKVSKNKPTSKESLQLLMYWIMGKHSQMFIYQNTRFITLLNPKRGEVYTMDTSLIDRGVIESVERDIICY